MQPNYRRVNYEKRCQIQAYLETKISISEISLRLKVHRSTIYRELKRHTTGSQTYRAEKAQLMSKTAFKRCRRSRIFFDREKVRLIEAELSRGLSPDQIANRFRVCSHQTIYSEIKKHRHDLKALLRKFKKHGRRGRPAVRTKALGAWFTSIQARPISVERREEFGHWERDSMYVSNRQMILVMLERKSRFVRLSKLPIPIFPNAAKETLKLMQVAGVKPLSITNDRGAEFRGATKIKTPIYFCDPQSPQQRGSVENMIGLLRQYLTLKTDVDSLNASDLLQIENKLNHRPRKCLGYRTPHEVIFNLPVALAT